MEDGGEAEGGKGEEWGGEGGGGGTRGPRGRSLPRNEAFN